MLMIFLLFPAFNIGPPQYAFVTAFCALLAGVGGFYTIVSTRANTRRETELNTIRLAHETEMAQREHELEVLKQNNENQLAERAQELAVLKQAQDALAVGLVYSERANAALRVDLDSARTAIKDLQTTMASNEERCKLQLKQLNDMIRNLGGTPP